MQTPIPSETAIQTLTDLYVSRQQGKVSDKWALYLREYERIFAPYRSLLVSILEIGVQNGGSLEVWAEYFANASTIVGCDINPKCSNLVYESPKVSIVIGDVKNQATQAQIKEYSEYFDIVMDDGSHKSSDIIQTFCELFPRVKDGGIYIVEDLHASYWRDYGGGLYAPSSANAFFKALTDVCNQEHWGKPFSIEEYFKGLEFPFPIPAHAFSNVHRIEFLNSMCVIHKAPTELNVLGLRTVSGDQEPVHQITQLAGTTSRAPDQNSNPWSQAPRYESRMAEMTGRLAEREKELADLRRQKDQMEEQLLRAEGQLALLKDLFLGNGNLDSL